MDGILAEWFKAPSWKGGIVKAITGSNPVYSAIMKIDGCGNSRFLLRMIGDILMILIDKFLNMKNIVLTLSKNSCYCRKRNF